VVFQKIGKTISCSSDDSILEIAEQAGVKIRSSCRVGTCGTCKKRKLAGEVRLDDYDPEALEPDEIAEGYILTCVAHPVGEVVIDA
jgi:ferredoxin